jgi:D-alanyl-D-alanine dipeptidase
MDLEDKYTKIEKGFLLYRDTCQVSKVNPITDGEQFVKLPPEMTDKNCKYPLVRETVLKKLCAADMWLKTKDKDFQLVVVDAYRPLDIQKRAFADALERANKDIEAAHKQIAVPEVAGHPTGGAVDVVIYDKQKAGLLDFGTGYCNWGAGRKLYYASPEISKQAMKNRKLLRTAMIKQGFLQYTGEWWHFSYGDKEWAFVNNKDAAYYDQKQIF